MQQTYAVGTAPRIIIRQLNGDLSVRVLNEQIVRIEVDDDDESGLVREGDTFVLTGYSDDLELQVPADTSIRGEYLNGDVDIRGVQRVELEHVSNDLKLRDIAEAIEIGSLGSDLEVKNSTALHARDGIGGDASLEAVASIEIEGVAGDLSIKGAGNAIIGSVGGDAHAEDVAAAFRCGSVGGDCYVRAGADAEVVVGSIGSDFEMIGGARVQAGNVGGDCEARDVRGALEVGHAGGDIDFNGVGGNLEIGNVGGDARLRGLQGGIEVGAVGGDLSLQAAFPAGSHTRLNVGSDAEVVLPGEPNLSVRAAVGGDVSGSGITASDGGNLLTLVYGEGAARLEMNVGGDLSLRGGNPRSSSSSTRSWGNFATGSWSDFEREMQDLGREMGKLGQDLGREMAKLGQDLSREFGAAGRSQSSQWAEEVSRKIREQAGRAQKRADEWVRHVDEQTRRAEERASRLNVRINNREWRLDPERLERMREQARRAAAEGVAGALEAVERAVKNLGFPLAPGSPTPPPPPSPPAAPAPPAPPVSSASEMSSQSAPARPSESTPPQREAATAASDAPEPTLEQEREAILRMIAEGRISPEEGDLLLESLGD